VAKGSNTRAALLAAAMSFIPATPVDIFRFLRVPAIVLILRARRGRVCRAEHCAGDPREASRRSRHGWHR